MRIETLVIVFSLVAFFYGLYIMLTPDDGPRYVRRFATGLVCLLAGAGIATYQLLHL